VIRSPAFLISLGPRLFQHFTAPGSLVEGVDLLQVPTNPLDRRALGRWGRTQYNVRRGDLDEAPIGLLFTLAGDEPCERVAPAFNQHPVYRPVVSEN
jgi:hypothetical protein